MMPNGNAITPNFQEDKELQTSMSPSSIFCAPLAEFHGRVPDPKQGMFRKSTECTYINIDNVYIPAKLQLCTLCSLSLGVMS